MLPRRIPKAPKRASRWRSQAHCTFVRSHECVVPGCHERPIEVMHIRLGSHTGLAQKPDDFWTCSGCRSHHSEAHAIGEASFQRKYNIDLRALAEEFCKESPKRAEIAAEKANRG